MSTLVNTENLINQLMKTEKQTAVSKELEARSVALSSLLRASVHEFNGVFGNSLNLAQMIKNKAFASLSDDELRYLDLVISENQLALKKVARFTECADLIEASSEKSQFNLDSLLRELLLKKDRSWSAHRSNIQIEGTLPSVLTKKQNWEIIFEELLDNYVYHCVKKAASPKEAVLRIYLDARQAGRCICLSNAMPSELDAEKLNYLQKSFKSGERNSEEAFITDNLRTGLGFTLIAQAAQDADIDMTIKSENKRFEVSLAF